MIFIQTVLLIFFLAVVAFLGRLILDYRDKLFRFGRIPIYLSVGLAGAGLIHYFFRALGLPWWVTLIFIILIIFVTIPGFNFKFDLKISKFSAMAYIIFFIAGLITLSGGSFFEGFDFTGNLYMHGANSHDSLWHIALQESIKENIPPANPLYLPQKISEYHFLTDIVVSLISQATAISTISLYLRWFPLLLAFLFISTLLILMMNLTSSTIMAFLGASLVIFGSGFAYLAPLFFPTAGNFQSVFWLDQPVHYLANHQLTFSLILMNVIFILSLDSIKKYWLVIGILLGSLAGIKIYGFIVLISALFPIGSYLFIVKRNWHYLAAVSVGLGLGIALVVFSGFGLGFPFIFYPGWFIKSMYEAKDRLNLSEWEIHRQLFTQTQNYFRLSLHWLTGLAVFLFGNFNFKILGLPLLLFLLRSKKVEPFFLLSGMVVIFSLSLPLLVIQKGIAWNTIQFMHYSQIPLVIGLLLFTARYFSKAKQLIFLSVILLFALPTTIQDAAKNFDPLSYQKVDRELIDGLVGLKKIIPPNQTLIVGSYFYGSSFVPALSKRAVYFADPVILDILRINYTDRLSYISSIEQGLRYCSGGEVILLNKDANIPPPRIIFQNNFFLIAKCDQPSLVSSP